MTTPSPPDPFAAAVTARDIYGSLSELRGELHADRTTQALLRRDVDDLKTHDRDQETRLRALERWRWGLPVSAVGSIAAAIAAIAAVAQGVGG